MSRFNLLLGILVAAVALSTSSVAAASVSAPRAPAVVQSSSSCFFAKTRFLLHAGLAFGAFHHFIYNPFKAGDFTGPKKVSTIAKAAVAGAFVYHEITTATGYVHCLSLIHI